MAGAMHDHAMCGRYVLDATLEDLEELLPGWEVGEIAPRWNVAPSQPVAVALNDGMRRVTQARWGLVPWWANDAAIGSRAINARAESAAAKPAFREALERRRCLVLATGFYEWRPAARRGGRKRPVLVRRPDGKPFAMAGLWDEWRPKGAPSSKPKLRTCTILTCDPSPDVADLHDRMPVILEAGDHATWLDPAPRPPAGLAPLLHPYRGPLALRDVSVAVNTPDHDAPDCVEPIAADGEEPVDDPQGDLFEP